VEVARDRTVGFVRGDEGCYGDGGGVGEELGDLWRVGWSVYLTATIILFSLRGLKTRRQCTHLRDTSDVLVTVLLAETQVLVQPEAHIVSVESVYSQALLQEVLLESDGDGGLSGGGETSEPEGETLLLAELIALGAREGCVPCDVAVR